MNLSLVASFTKIFSSKLSPSFAPKKQSNSPQVDLSSKLANNSKLTSNKYKKHLRNNLKLNSCPKKQTMVTSKSCSASAVTSKKNREWPLGLCIDWGLHWTSLCSNEFYLTQCIYSFWSPFTFYFSYYFLDFWSVSYTKSTCPEITSLQWYHLPII